MAMRDDERAWCKKAGWSDNEIIARQVRGWDDSTELDGDQIGAIIYALASDPSLWVDFKGEVAATQRSIEEACASR